MTVQLFRVDDRLVHGQVVLGWGRPLAAAFIVLVDDGVFASEWEQELYRMAVPAGVEVIFTDVAGARRQLPAWMADPRPGIVLTAGVASMAALHDAVPAIVHRINLGGLHHRPGRVERLPYIYLGEADEALLRRLVHDGAEISAQDLPTTPAVTLEALLR